MPEIVVPAESRTETGKNANRRLRSRGMIPGVVYAEGKDAVAVAVSPREIGTILKSAAGENTLFDLELGGTRRKVILKEFQRGAAARPASCTRTSTRSRSTRRSRSRSTSSSRACPWASSSRAASSTS